ncbi:MAG: nuclear transport factor 2 family protein [Proteobacteria bacterium]|nr:nuclear transport factor 2 family protein [Pseudomonadota bacterium]
MASLLADDFMFYGDDAIVLDRDGFLSAMEQDEMRIESLELSDVESFLSDDNTLAFVRYSLALRSWIDGRRHDVQTVETVILRRTDNASAEWQLVQNHASLKPL